MPPVAKGANLPSSTVINFGNAALSVHFNGGNLQKSLLKYPA